MRARERTERMARRATLSLPDPSWVIAGGVACVADGGVGTCRCWLSVCELGCSGITGLFSKTPESSELYRARESESLAGQTGLGAVRKNSMYQ